MKFSVLGRFRDSTVLIVLIVSLALFTDNLLFTFVDPILPSILRNLYDISNNSTNNTININKHGRFGLLVAAKGGAQFILNPLVGMLVTRYGYRRPMAIGEAVLLVSAVAMGYGQNYAQLFVTRIFQGISSAITAVTSMGLLAATFVDDEERGRMMGIAIGALSLGITTGPVYGSLLYEFVGPRVPFISTGIIIGLALVMQCLTLHADSGSKDHSMTSIMRLVVDPYIMLVAGSICMVNVNVSVILAFLPLRLIELTHPETWKLGVVVLPASIGFMISSLIFSRTTRYLPRWLSAMLGLLVGSASLAGLAFAGTFVTMLVMTSFLGLSVGMVTVPMQPVFARIVDLRHSSVYGNVYAISDMSVCLGVTLGALVGGPVLYAIGFQRMLLCVALMNLLYAALPHLLRNLDLCTDVTDAEKNNSKLVNKGDEKTQILLSRIRSNSMSSIQSSVFHLIHRRILVIWWIFTTVRLWPCAVQDTTDLTDNFIPLVKKDT